MIHFISQYFAAVTAEYWKHGKTHFCLMFPFYIPWKYQKTKGFLVFPGGVQLEHWAEMG